MAIHEVTDTEVLQTCAKCGAENRVPLASLEVGVARETLVDGRVLPLPSCPACRSTEYLLRSPDDEPQYPESGGVGYLHRLLVDHVHAELVRKEQVHPLLKDGTGQVDPTLARPLSVETVARWFPNGMRLDAPGQERP